MLDIDFTKLSERQLQIVRKMLSWAECLSVVKNDYARVTTGRQLEDLWREWEREEQRKSLQSQ